MGYTNIFGGYNINTAFPSYKFYPMSVNIQLTWASSFVDNSNVTAQINDLIPTEEDLTVTLADATMVSVGQEIQFNNIGFEEVAILDFEGNEIAVIPPTGNNQYILYLRDNSTPGGIWGITHLGAGTSSADASVLAGFGLIPLDSKLNTNFPGKTVSGNYQVQLSDRGSILVWTGGAGTITLPPQLAGFPIAVNNEGSGAVVIDTPDAAKIDGEDTFDLNPSESSYFIGVETNWNTLGYGVESFFQVNVLSPLDLSAVGPSITLTNQQASRLVQQYTGVLTQDVTVYYPAASGQWYIWNNTMGPHTVTAQLSGPTGNPILIPQGEKVILYSDGVSIYNTPTIATSAVFPDGTQGAPGISFQSDSTTGFFKPPTPPAGVVGYSSAGTESLIFGGIASGIALEIKGGLPGVYWNTTNTFYTGLKAPLGLGSNLVFSLPSSYATVDGQILTGTTTGLTSFSAFRFDFPFDSQGIFYASDSTTISTLPTANNGVLITSSVGGVPSIGSTLPAPVQANITGLGIVTSGTVNVSAGGTGLNTLTTAYGVLCAGTTPTGPFQNAGVGTAGRVLTSNGPGALPTWDVIPSSISAASKAQQQAGTSLTTYVSPGRQQFHPSAASFWVDFNGATGSIFASYNVPSVNRNSVGNYTINFTNNFSSSNYVIVITVRGAMGNPVSTIVDSQSSSNFEIITYIAGGSPFDFDDVYVVGFGTLA